MEGAGRMEVGGGWSYGGWGGWRKDVDGGGRWMEGAGRSPERRQADSLGGGTGMACCKKSVRKKLRN